MRLSVIATIFRKELRDIFRDRRTLIVTIVLPILLYPLLLIGFTMLTAAQLGKLERKQVRIAVINESAAPTLMMALDTVSSIVKGDTAAWPAAISAGDLEAALEFEPGFERAIQENRLPRLTLYHNSSRDLSDQAASRVQDVIDRYQERLVRGRLLELSADTSLLRPFQLKDNNLATDEQRQGSLIGRVLGYILIIMTMMGAFYPAIDLTAGEKERGTLETLLVSPAGRGEIVYGKFVAVLSVSMITAILNIASIGLTMLYTVRILGKGSSALSSIAIEPMSLILALLLILPLAITFSAVCLAVAVGARTYKEGQGLLSPLYSVVILPAMVSLLPGTEMSPKLAAIPLVNVSLLIKEYMSGNYYWTETIIAFASTSLLAFLALSWAVSQFRQESVLFRHSEAVRWSPFRLQRRSAGPSAVLPTSGSALMLVAVGMILLFFMSGQAGAWSPVKAILASQMIVLLPVVVLIYRGGYDWKKVIRFQPPSSLAAWPATIMTILGGWILALSLAILQNYWFPFPEEFLDRFMEMFAALNDLSWPIALLIIAVLPGIIEEIFCRGIVMRSWIPRFGVTGGILLSALAFGLLHLDPYRFLGTTFLGILLGYIAYSTGSIIPSMLAHAMNNALSFSVQKYGDRFLADSWLDPNSTQMLPWYWLAAGIILLVCGLLWLNAQRNTLPKSTELPPPASQAP